MILLPILDTMGIKDICEPMLRAIMVASTEHNQNTRVSKASVTKLGQGTVITPAVNAARRTEVLYTFLP